MFWAEFQYVVFIITSLWILKGGFAFIFFKKKEKHKLLIGRPRATPESGNNSVCMRERGSEFIGKKFSCKKHKEKQDLMDI